MAPLAPQLQRRIVSSAGSAQRQCLLATPRHPAMSSVASTRGSLLLTRAGRPWQLPVGAEHGEAFSDMRGDMVGRRGWDVDELNERLELRGAARLRVAQAPDQAHAIIVQLDRLVLNMRRALAHAMDSLAKARGHAQCPPSTEHWEQLLDKHARSSPEHIMAQVLGLGQEPEVLQALSRELHDTHLPQALVHTAEPAPGLHRWLELVANYNMPVAAVTSLRRSTALGVLAHLHLHDHFQALVSSVDDEHENQAQTLLAAAMRLGRPPNLCAVFDGCPNGVTAAHNASMKAVAVACRAQPAWQLRTADVTVSSLDQLSVINVRRLFATLGTEAGDLLKQIDPTHAKKVANHSQNHHQRRWQERRAIMTDAYY